MMIYLGLSIYADFGNVIDAFKSFNWFYLPFLIILPFINYVIRFAKWEFYLHQLAIDLKRKDSFIIFMSGLVMTVTPGKMGEVLKSYLLKETYGTEISRSAPIVVAERLTDLIAFIILATFGVFSFGYGYKILLITSAIILSTLFVIGSRKLSFSIIKLCERLPLISRFAGKMEVAYDSIAQLVTLRNLLIATVISVFSWSCECYAFYLIFKGFNTPITLFNATFIYAFATIAGAVTMLPGGLGATEGSMTGLLVLVAKVNIGTAVAATFIIRTATLWFAVLVGSVMVFIYQTTLQRPHSADIGFGETLQ